MAKTKNVSSKTTATLAVAATSAPATSAPATSGSDDKSKVLKQEARRKYGDALTTLGVATKVLADLDRIIRRARDDVRTIEQLEVVQKKFQTNFDMVDNNLSIAWNQAIYGSRVQIERFNLKAARQAAEKATKAEKAPAKTPKKADKDPKGKFAFQNKPVQDAGTALR